MAATIKEKKAPPPIVRNEMRPVPNYADSFWCTYIVSVVAANIAELGEFM